MIYDYKYINDILNKGSFMTELDFLNACKLKNNAGLGIINEFIKNNNVRIIKNIKSDDGYSSGPLHIAVKAGNNEIVDTLLELGLNPMERDGSKLAKTPIIYALEKGFVEIALNLLSSKNLKTLKTPKRYSEASALGNNLKISISDYIKVLSKLIEVGFDVDLLDNTRVTPLIRAIQTNSIDRVKVCIKLGLNLNHPFRMPLAVAMHMDPMNNEIIKLILDSGASIHDNSDDEWDNFNALHMAHYRSNVEIFEYLIKKHNALDSLNDSTLDDIIKYKEIEFLSLLWEIPKVHEFIIKHDLLEAFPKEARNLFLF